MTIAVQMHSVRSAEKLSPSDSFQDITAQESL